MNLSVSDLFARDLLAFQLFDWLGAESEAHDRETILAMVDMAQSLALEDFASHYRKADIEEPRLDETGVHILPEIGGALRRYRELGLFGASFPENLGGLGLSFCTSLSLYGVFAAANIATASYTMLTTANARLIAAFGSPQQIDRFALPQIDGRWFGTMCLSEPQAGSSLGDIRVRAQPDGDDENGARYRVFGAKMWISGGDQDVSDNIVHLVLAKVMQADGAITPGSKAISLFIVPKYLPDGARNDVVASGLNHKMGWRGTSNCLLNFGENEGAIGWRVGAEGQGLAQMFMMMNEARISVGMGAAALAYRGYRQALRYAHERTQGRAIGVQGGEPLPIFLHPDVRRMLLQQKVYAEGALALCLYCARLVDDKSPESESLLALLTPVAKTWPSEFGAAALDLAIQVHGGYGYTRDFDVEQLWRDNRLNPIHEGTTGVQAIDLLRRKILLSDGQSMALLRARIAATVQKAQERPEWTILGAALAEYWGRVSAVVAGLQTIGGPAAFDDATLFLRAFGHGVIAWLWLDQVMYALQHQDSALKTGLHFACRFFFESELPQAGAWLSIVDGHSDLARTIPDIAYA